MNKKEDEKIVMSVVKGCLLVFGVICGLMIIAKFG